MLKSPLDNKNLLKRQKLFIESIEGLGDIMVFDAKKKRNKSVENDLKRMKEIFDQFLSLQQNEPEKFEQMLLAEEFFDIQKKDEREASMRLAFSPDRYLVSFSIPINQIIRVHEAALEVKNGEISRLAVYYLVHILADLSKIKGNDLLVENLLGKIANTFINSLKEEDGSMYASGIHWYTDIVFNNLGDGESFNLDYLELFDKYFFSTTRYLISEIKTKVFKSLVSTFNDGTHIKFFYSADIHSSLFSLINLIESKKYFEISQKHNLNTLVDNLSRNASLINDKKKLETWLGDYKKFADIINQSIKSDKFSERDKISKEIIKFADSRLKYNHLLELVFAIGSYCLFKYFDQKNDTFLSYIRELWEAHQPKDSDASWIGYDIVPKQIDDLVALFFGDVSWDRKLNFWEGHHGSEVYYRKYFLLLLLRALQSINPDADGKYPTIENYKLPILQIYRLSDLKYIVDQLVPLVSSFKVDKQILIQLEFKESEIEEFLDKKLLPLLQRMKTQADEQLEDVSRTQHIGEDKVNNFKEDVLEGYNKSGIFRNIFKLYGKYTDKSNEVYQGTLDRFGINQIFDKEAFFKEWYVHYGDFGKDYGRNVSTGEDNFLATELFKLPTSNDGNSDLDSILGKIKQKEHIAIFIANIMLYEYFQNLPNFIQKWRNDLPTTKAQGTSGFEGVYKFEDVNVPIFAIPNNALDKQILIINTQTLGNLTQLAPLKDETERQFQKENLYINVQEYLPDSELLNTLLEKAPEWLTKHGSREEQIKYLQEKVLITINERFEYQPSKESEAYILNIE